MNQYNSPIVNRLRSNKDYKLTKPLNKPNASAEFVYLVEQICSKKQQCVFEDPNTIFADLDVTCFSQDSPDLIDQICQKLDET
ncbi:unnamed protein product, partial [Brachionus calyciflorus]